MTEQSPEVFAHADLSPASPKPIHHTATSPALIPSLQERADTLDVAYLDSLVPPAFAFVTMPAATDPASDPSESQEVADTIVVGGEDYSDDDESNDGVDEESLDAYGEEDDGEKQQKEQQDQAEAAQPTSQLPDMDVDNAGPGDGDADGKVAADDTEANPNAAHDQPGAPDKAVVSETSSNINTPSSSEPDVMMTSESPTVHPSTSAPSSHPVSASTTAPEPATEQKPNPNQPEEKEVTTTTPPASVPSHSSPTGPVTAADAVSEASASPIVEMQASQPNGHGAIDIQKLVDSITARATESSAATMANPNSTTNVPASHNPSLPTQGTAPPSSSLPLAPSSSLPAKPVVARQAGPRPEDFHPFHSRGHNNSQVIASQGQPITAGHGGPPNAASYVGGVPAASSLPPHPHYSAFGGSQGPQTSAQPLPGPDGLHGATLQQAWEQFQADEKRYMTEAKWERFPDNSRIFIGNLSSERVSKREVFDLFHRYGRLAQISLKSAYGFVQYHSAEDAARAMAGAQGLELGGRKINMEFSKTQKRKDANERDHSPDRRGIRGGERGSRGSFDRFDGRDRGGPRNRDDYRPGGRSPSPRRDSGYGRDRFQHGGYDQRNPRDRSRSPKRYGRHDQDSYRRRSRSPQRRGPPEPELDAARRYGDQVPDVQILLLGQLDQRFVDWVRGYFTARGLKDDVIIFNPRFSRDPLMTRMILEGVHGVVELDLAAQQKAKIPLRSFDRSAGIGNVRFDQYQDLDPAQAAEVVFRTKQAQAQAPPQIAPQPAYAPSQYPPHNAYPPQHGVQPPQAYPPAGYPGYPQAPPAAFVPAAQPNPGHAPVLSAQDIAGMAGKVDNATLQALLASLGSGAGQGAPAPAQPQQQPGHPQVDINALLGSLNQQSTATPPVPGYPYNGAYPPPAAPGQPPAQAPPGGGDAMKDILATLSRYR